MEKKVAQAEQILAAVRAHPGEDFDTYARILAGSLFDSKGLPYESLRKRRDAVGKRLDTLRKAGLVEVRGTTQFGLQRWFPL